MSRVTITISGQSFDIECPANQETYIKSLASSLQARVDSVSASFPGATLLRLLVVVALTLEDDIQTRPVTRADSSSLSEPEGESSSSSRSVSSASSVEDDKQASADHYHAISAILEPLIERIERIASLPEDELSSESV